MRALLDAKAAIDAALEAHKTATPFVGSHLVEARLLIDAAIRREAELRKNNQRLRRELMQTRRKAAELAKAGRSDVTTTSAELVAHLRQETP